MKVNINLDSEAISDLGITIEQFQQAASYALSNLAHPETGDPIYFNEVRVIVVADCPEISCS